MRRDRRPINADVPGIDTPELATEEAPKPEATPKKAPVPEKKAEQPQPPRQRREVPGALKAVVGLALLGIVFLVAAIVGGSGGGSDEAPAPVVTTPAQGGDDAGAEPAAGANELGYPAFATGNTTRVGGADAGANAAAVALAVFPATTEEQRPAAVTVVGAEDWAGGIAASVLMAEPVRAPVLIADSDATAEALGALRPAQGGAARRRQPD